MIPKKHNYEFRSFPGLASRRCWSARRDSVWRSLGSFFVRTRQGPDLLFLHDIFFAKAVTGCSKKLTALRRVNKPSPRLTLARLTRKDNIAKFVII